MVTLTGNDILNALNLIEQSLGGAGSTLATALRALLNRIQSSGGNSATLTPAEITQLQGSIGPFLAQANGSAGGGVGFGFDSLRAINAALTSTNNGNNGGGGGGGGNNGGGSPAAPPPNNGLMNSTSGATLADTSGRIGSAQDLFSQGADFSGLTPSDFDYNFNWVGNPSGAARNVVKQFGFNNDNNPYTAFLQDRARDIGASEMAAEVSSGGQQYKLNSSDVTPNVANRLGAGGSRGVTGLYGSLAGLEGRGIGTGPNPGTGGNSQDQQSYLLQMADNPSMMGDIFGAQGSAMLQQASSRLFNRLYQDYRNAAPGSTPGFFSFLNKNKGWN